MADSDLTNSLSKSTTKQHDLVAKMILVEINRNTEWKSIKNLLIESVKVFRTTGEAFRFLLSACTDDPFLSSMVFNAKSWTNGNEVWKEYVNVILAKIQERESFERNIVDLAVIQQGKTERAVNFCYRALRLAEKINYTNLVTLSKFIASRMNKSAQLHVQYFANQGIFFSNWGEAAAIHNDQLIENLINTAAVAGKPCPFAIAGPSILNYYTYSHLPQCKFCNRFHTDSTSCAALDSSKVCFICHKTGHFALCCSNFNLRAEFWRQAEILKI